MSCVLQQKNAFRQTSMQMAEDNSTISVKVLHNFHEFRLSNRQVLFIAYTHVHLSPLCVFKCLLKLLA